MELLIIKSGEKYIRHKNGAFTLSTLDKASVFPMEKLEAVKEHVAALRAKNFSQICIRKLKLTEEAFEDGEEKC